MSRTENRREFVKEIAIGASGLFIAPSTTETGQNGWDLVPSILRRIVPPRFPSRDFDVTRYGARRDGSADCTDAFRNAIAACANAGGGRVVIPAGRFLTGAIHLASKVNLHVESGATIAFSQDPTKYLPVVLTRFEGVEVMNYSPLVYAFGCENVAVTGSGTLDGQADDNHWWQWARAPGQGAGTGLARESRTRLFEMAEGGVPVGKRAFGGGSYLRPSFIETYRCHNVLIEGITIINSPMWEIHPVLSRNVTVRGVSINSHGPNNDGCDPESCRDVLIDKCLFDTGDDCIAIKSGRNADGRRIAAPSENIIVRGCEMRDGHGGVTIGSEISGGVRNVFAENCKMDSPHLDRALRVKNNAARGGLLEHIYMRNVTVGEVADAVLSIDFNYEEGPKGEFMPIVRDVEMRHVTSRKSQYALYLRGLEKSTISDIRIIDCDFENVAKPNVVERVTNLRLANTRISTQPWSASFAEAVVARNPQVHTRWDYTAGVVLLAIDKVAKSTRSDSLRAYVRRNIDQMVQPDGTISGYNADEFNLDQIAEGRLLFPLFAQTHDERYRKAAETLRDQLRHQPRTAAGGFWHKKIYPQQMWLDGLYMAEPFYAQYAKDFGDPKIFEDVAQQFLLAGRHMRDPRTGLMYHGWDAAKAQPWANRETGLSGSFWGRAMGWYMVGLVDTLDYFPREHHDRNALIQSLKQTVEAIARVQDSGTGLWWQVLDYPHDAGNYLEASASSMFVYSLAKGARMGYLDARYRRNAERGFDGLISNLVKTGSDGRPSLTNICQVAGLGGAPRKDGSLRDGSYAYYVSEPIVADDYKGVGPFIMAAQELGK